MPKVTKTEDTESENQFGLASSNKKSKSHFFPWLLLIVVVLVAGAFVFMQQRNETTLKNQIMELKKNPQKASEEETKALLDKVGMLIELPNEQPTIATVTDLAPLKDQPFFANAQVNDKVLIFSQAKKAVLYRPSTNKVIEVAPVNLDSTAVNANTNKAGSSANENSNTNTKTPITKTKTTNTNTK